MRIFCCLMVMFVIGGIATHTERLFADSRASNTCSFCGHNIGNGENGHFSKQNSKKRCKFCGHGLGSGEYNREKDGYKSQFSGHNYDDEEIESESGKKHSGTKKKKNKGKYALDLRGVHFYDEDIESFESEEENDDSAAFSNQRNHVKSLDDWDEDDDSSYDDEDEGEESEYEEFDEEEEPEEEDQSEEADPDNDNGESATPTAVFPSQMTNIGTPQLPIMQQLPTGILPTASTEETTAFPTLQPNEMQNPALLQSMQYPASEQQNQTATMDSNALAAQYPYNQQNIGNPNINLQQNQMLQDNQNGMNDMNNNAYGQMNGASMMSQYGNAGINQQDYASVVNETIGYLQEMGLLDENRVSKMSAGMVEGKCIICMKQKFVFQIRGQGTLGVCEDCLRSRDSYGGAFGAGGIKGVLEKGVMSLFGGGNDDNRGGSGNNGIRSYGSGGGYDDSGGGYYRNPYSNGEMMGNGTPSQGSGNSLRSLADKLTGATGSGFGGIFGGGNNIFGNGTNGGAGAGSQQMVMNAQGQLVPMGSDPSAPYGYVKDPSTGQMRPATSPEEGLAAGAAAAAAGATAAPGVANGTTAGTTATGTIAGGSAGAGGQQMVMNAQGQLVPMGSDPSAPYGYVKDPSTGQMRPATSAAEGLAAGAAAAAAGATTAPGVANGTTAGTTATGTTTSGGAGAGSQQMVMNAAGQLVPMGSDPSAPYGYVKDPSTGQMRPATSPEEGLAAGAAAAAAGATAAPGVANGTTAGTTATGTTVGGSAGAGGQQMVMNAAGQLVPMGSDPNAPYGYVKDPSTGQMRPATSPEEGLAAGAAAAAAGATTAPGVANSVTGAVATATGAVENATNTAVGVANTAVNAANNAAATAANTASQVANSAEAIKNAAQPLTSLASSVGSLVSSIASGIQSKSASTNENSSTYSDNDNSRQSTSKQNDTSNSNNQSRKKKKKRKSSTASADGSSGTNSGTQQQSSRKKKKQKDSTASAKDTSGTQQSTKKKKKSSKAT